MTKRVSVAVMLCITMALGFAWMHTPSAKASGCSPSYYQYCQTLWLNPGQMYSLDGYEFPEDPYAVPPCESLGDPDLCWQIHSQTNTTWNTNFIFTQAIAYDTCNGGYSWVEHSNQDSTAHGSGTYAVGSDAYGMYSDCGPGDDHLYALDTYHSEQTNPDPNYYNDDNWYQF